MNPDARLADPASIVAGEHMERSIHAFQLACSVALEEEQERPNPNNALIAILCDAVRLSREHVRLRAGAGQFEDANGDRIKNRYEVAVVTESGCKPKEGEFNVLITRIVLGDVGADDHGLVSDCIADALDELELPEEGVTGLILQETGEFDGFPQWHKFYEIAERNVDIFHD